MESNHSFIIRLAVLVFFSVIFPISNIIPTKVIAPITIKTIFIVMNFILSFCEVLTGIGFKSSVVGRNDAKESSPDVIADGVVVLRKTKGHNTVLVTQAPPRGASAHARYLAASKISARQDGRTVLRTRLVFAVSPRSALSHSNLATCFRQSAKGFNAEICVRRS